MGVGHWNAESYLHKDKARSFKRKKKKKKLRACAQVEHGSLKTKSSMCVSLTFRKCVHAFLQPNW